MCHTCAGCVNTYSDECSCRFAKQRSGADRCDRTQAAAAGASGIGTTVVGTYGYMAPEQFRGAASPASDLYGLGGTLLFLLSGAGEIQGSDRAWA